MAPDADLVLLRALSFTRNHHWEHPSYSGESSLTPDPCNVDQPGFLYYGANHIFSINDKFL